jgi:DNA-directed RNA polymerase III subunit RPC2
MEVKHCILDEAVAEAQARRRLMRECGDGDGMLDDVNGLCDADDLTRPVKAATDKYKLLPAFLAVRGLVRQHLDSYNHFIRTEIRNILRANDKITSDVDPKFFMRYEDIQVLSPSHVEESVSVSMPIAPHECRLRDMTYTSPVEVTVRYTRGEEIMVQKGVRIGCIPVMLRSDICTLYGKTPADLASVGECPLDPGGYFVVRGTEKVVLMQEQLSRNRIIVEQDAKGISASVQSETHERKSRTSIVVRNRKLYMQHNTFEQEGINLAIVFRALGVETDMEILQFVGCEVKFVEALAPTIEECAQYGIRTTTQALRHMGNRTKTFRSPFGGGGSRFGRGGGFSGGGGGTQRSAPAGGASTDPIAAAADKTTAQIQRKIETARDLLANAVLNHIPTKMYNFSDKIVFLAQMTRRVLLAVDDRTQLDDKDYYGNKRLELPGQLVAMLFEDLFKKFNSDLKRSIDTAIQKEQVHAGKSMRKEGRLEEAAQVRSKYRSNVDVTRCIRTDTITQGLEFAISTGNWSLKRFKMERSGVTEVLSRLSFIAALGMMTRVTSQFEKTRKVSGPRALQPSQWGMLCPSDTPEGESCGLVKNLALMSHVTTETEDSPMVRLLYDLGVQSTSYLSGEEINENYVVFLNGLILGVHTVPSLLCSRIRFLRRHGLIGEFVSVYEQTQQRCVYIASDAGRVCRPLVIVDPVTGISKLTSDHIARVASESMTFRDLLDEGVIEFVDVNEQNNCLIATWEPEIDAGMTTHLEISPLTLLGVCAGLIPYPHHNQSPRNTYQCAMGKQAIGSIAYNQHKRTDTLLYLLSYPQRPLVQTKTLALVGFERLPGGQNASLVVMSYSGYDIEDAVVLNKASLDRGFGRCSVIRKNVTGCRRYTTGVSDRIMRPPDDVDRSSVVDVNSPEASASVADRRSARYSALDEDGMAAPGTRLSAGHIFVNKEVPMDTAIQRGGGIPMAAGQGTPYRSQPLAYKGTVPVVVDKVLVTSNDTDHVLVKTMLRDTRRPELGDKFSSRHGQKGVCGLIALQEDMPFSDAGIVPDLVMNPHGM